MISSSLRLVLSGLFLAASAFAADPAPPSQPDPAARLAAIRKIADGLKYQTGVIDLHRGLAKIALPETYRYLDAAGASTVLSDIWGNPRGGDTLGMIVPAKFDPPPAQPMTTSGQASAMASCSIASWPITV